MYTFKLIMYAFGLAVIASLLVLLAGLLFGFQFTEWAGSEGRIVGVVGTIAGAAGAAPGLWLAVRTENHTTRCLARRAHQRFCNEKAALHISSHLHVDRR